MRFLVYVAMTLAAAPAAAQDAVIPSITNLKEISNNLKLSQFKGKKFARRIKVAVLDNGFNGHEDEKKKGITLPKDVHYDPGIESDADNLPSSSFHGLVMAQILYLIVKNSVTEPDLELRLINAFGYKKFAHAVDEVIKGKFHLVLYSQVWEFGGFGDNKGFINTQVNRATEAGIVWINAAGNFGKLTRLAKIDGKAEGTDEYVVFHDKQGKSAEGASVVCTPPPQKDTCNLRLVLAWNDFKENPHTGSDKDLDLILLDSEKQLVKQSLLRQVLDKDEDDGKTSAFPREMIEQQIKKGTYTARVKIHSKNFSASQDQLRLTASGSWITLPDATEGETLLPPADNSTVITVGASDDAGATSKSVKMDKPEIYLKSVIQLKDGSSPFSSSTAAAMAAGVSTLHLGTGTELGRAAILKKLQLLTPSTKRPAPPVSFRSVKTGNCLPRTYLPKLYHNARALIARGGIVVGVDNRPAILVKFSLPREERITVPRGSSIFVYPGGLQVADVRLASAFGADVYEVLEAQHSPPVCR